VPPILDLSRVKRAYTVSDADALEHARLLLRKEGVLAGSSTGVLLAAALRYCREQTQPKRVCTLVCDSGNKYLSKQFNDAWMADRGFLARPRTGGLEDLVTRRHADRAVVTVGPDDTLLTALSRMKAHDVSQLPVLDGTVVVGMLDESDLLLAGLKDPAHLKARVQDVMSTRLETLETTASLDDALKLLDQGFVPIVLRQGVFIGLLTRMDVLGYLRQRVR
jgi:cystathionine beta-synthase